MKFNIKKKLLLVIISPIFLIGCSQNKIIDTDLSNLPKPNKDKIVTKVNQTNIEPIDKKFISDLVPLKDREQVLTNYKYGKKDPFSEDFQINNLSFDFKLKGFLTTQNNKYVFVNYRDKEGVITEDSIGGVNTSLLPDLAKVIKIDPKNKKLIILYDNEEFVLML